MECEFAVNLLQSCELTKELVNIARNSAFIHRKQKHTNNIKCFAFHISYQ
jgi:hypothetical protein